MWNLSLCKLYDTCGKARKESALKSTDISSLNVRKLITCSIEVSSKMIKNDRRFTIHITSTVQKILRICTGKQTIKGVPV